MSEGVEEFWSSLPKKAVHPLRVPILEALRRTGEPLSAVAAVDVFDGELTMWEVDHHLRALEDLGVVEASSAREDGRQRREDGFDLRYRLKRPEAGDGE